MVRKIFHLNVWHERFILDGSTIVLKCLCLKSSFSLSFRPITLATILLIFNSQAMLQKLARFVE